MLLLTCIVIYSFCARMIRLCYQPNQDELHPSAADRALSWSALSLLGIALVLGFWQPDLLRGIISEIASRYEPPDHRQHGPGRAAGRDSTRSTTRPLYEDLCR